MQTETLFPRTHCDITNFKPTSYRNSRFFFPKKLHSPSLTLPRESLIAVMGSTRGKKTLPRPIFKLDSGIPTASQKNYISFQVDTACPKNMKNSFKTPVSHIQKKHLILSEAHAL